MAGERALKLSQALPGITSQTAQAEGTPETDEVWVQRALESSAVFEELVNRYQRRIYAYAYRYTGRAEDAEDIVQETFVRAYRSLKTFDSSRSFSPWIYKIAGNLCHSFHASKKSAEPLEQARELRSRLGNPEESADPTPSWKRAMK